MALMRSFFRGKNNQTSCRLKTEQITLEILKHFIPVRNLSEDSLQAFAMENKTEVLAAGETLFKCHEKSVSVIYLLKGIVVLSDDHNNEFTVEADTAKAKFPLSSGKTYNTTAVAKTDISFFRVSQKIMSMDTHPDNDKQIVIPAELKQSRLLQSFVQHFLDGELDIPILPTVAVRLRKAMEKEIGIHEAVQIIQTDTVMSAKLVEVANCPLYLSAVPAKSCLEAVNRIGLNATRSLVVSLSLKNIFKGHSSKIKKYLDQQWKASIYLSCLCYVLASVSHQKNPEEALLAGLVCDIGVIPFLSFVADLPDDYYDEDEMSQSIPVVKGIVGASILKKWGFSDEFIEAALHSGDWYQAGGEQLSYTDIIVLSRLHSAIGRKMANLPTITSIPAASKLTSIHLSPENSLGILYDAKDKVNTTLKTFTL